MQDIDEARSAAISKIKARRDFRTHLVAYVVVNAFLIGVWAVAGQGYFWPVWVIAGWGIGLILHAWTTYNERPISEDEIRREVGRSG